MTGERVLVAEAGVLQALLPEADVTPQALADPAALLLRLKTRDPALPARQPFPRRPCRTEEAIMH